jgi:PAS domain S-box-containing protein
MVVGVLNDQEDLARVVCERAREFVGGVGVAVYVWAETSACLQPRYANDPHIAGPFPSLAAGEGAMGRAFQQRQAILVTDYLAWEHRVAWAAERGIQQVVAVPVLVAGRSVGALAVRFAPPTLCTGEHVELLGLFATQLATVLEAAMRSEVADWPDARLAATLEHLPVGLVVLDSTGHVIALNAEVRRLCGDDPDASRQVLEDEVGLLLQSVPPNVARMPDNTILARALRGEQVPENDIVVRPRRAAERRWVRVSAGPVRDTSGLPNGAIAMFTDVTHEHQLLQELASRTTRITRLARELADRELQLYEYMSTVLPDAVSHTSSDNVVSEREWQVLRLMAKGDTNRMIGEALGISTGTVRKHVEHILAKLEVTDRRQAVVRADERGLIKLPSR